MLTCNGFNILMNISLFFLNLVFTTSISGFILKPSLVVLKGHSTVFRGPCGSGDQIQPTRKLRMSQRAEMSL